jgi:hypothetical protein
VARWRGYRETCLILQSTGMLAESPSFRSKRFDQDAPAALDALDADLAGRGWRATGTTAGQWFERCYERLAVVEQVPEPAVTPSAVAIEPPPAAIEPSDPPSPPRSDARRLQRVEAPRPTPPPAHAPAETPTPAPTAPERRRRRLPVAHALAWVGLLVAISLLAVLLTQHRTAVAQARSTPRAQAPKHVAAPPPPRAASTRAATATEPPIPAARVHLLLAATRTSWLEVRRNSATGPVVFAGNLEAGRTIRATGHRLWARFGAAGNLTITANGKPVALTGTVERTFRPAAR